MPTQLASIATMWEELRFEIRRYGKADCPDFFVPSCPRPDDPTEKVHHYFRKVAAAGFKKFPTHPLIRKMQFNFTGTAADLRTATKKQLQAYMGSIFLGNRLDSNLRVTRFRNQTVSKACF